MSRPFNSKLSIIRSARLEWKNASRKQARAKYVYNNRGGEGWGQDVPQNPILHSSIGTTKREEGVIFGRCGRAEKLRDTFSLSLPFPH